MNLWETSDESRDPATHGSGTDHSARLVIAAEEIAAARARRLIQTFSEAVSFKDADRGVVAAPSHVATPDAIGIIGTGVAPRTALHGIAAIFVEAGFAVLADTVSIIVRGRTRLTAGCHEGWESKKAR